MDPLTQGIVGTTAAQLVSRKQVKVAAAVIGFFAGMAADIDVLISSSTDPLLFLEYHRHFTHGLVFIPVGALVCALVFRAVFKKWFTRNELGFKETYVFCFAGYATHALLDACTTYGTQLLWPFSDMRVAWNNVSVVDPIFTLPLLVIIYFATFKGSTRLAYLGAVYALSYLALGVVQGQRAETIATELALSRGHEPINLGVKPSMANIIVWKSVYEHEGQYYVDAVRALGNTKIYSGTSTPKLDIEEHFPWLSKDTQQAKDIERFRWFSNQHLGLDPENKNRIIDIRYSLVPNQVTGMWGIVLDKNKDQLDHVEWTANRPKGQLARQKGAELWSMVLGR